MSVEAVIICEKREKEKCIMIKCNRNKTLLALFVCLLFASSCNGIGAEQDSDTSIVQDNKKAEKNNQGEEKQLQQTLEKEESYINEDGTCIKDRINVPKGFTRVSYKKKSFGAFLRNYPLCDSGQPVLLYDGREKGNQNAHVAVFAMDVTDGDLQQCADSVIRMYAEYFYKYKQYDKMKFQFVNGFSCDFDKWSQGMRVSVDGNDTNWYQGASADNSKDALESYLRTVFGYASTLSMEQESEAIKIEDIQVGDIFIRGGSPGHVVMVVDVCENEKGEKAFLLAQGYMPAQQFHILKNPKHEDNPWYYETEISYPFHTPEYTFEEGSLMRPQYNR